MPNHQSFSAPILLIGNFVEDKQESMQRLLHLISDELKARQITHKVIRPFPVLTQFFRNIPFLHKWVGYVDKLILFPFYLIFLLKKNSFAIAHIIDHSNAFYLPYLKKIPNIITCNDLLAIKSAEKHYTHNKTGFTGCLLQRWIKSNLKKASVVAFISQKTGDDFKDIIGIKNKLTTVIPLPLQYPYQPLSRDKLDDLLKITYPKLLGTPYLIHVGSNSWYKNRKGLIALFSSTKSHFSSPLNLVIAGEPLNAALKNYAKNLGVLPFIIEIQKPSNTLLNALYCQSEALLFPSLEEGYGWPVLEAIAAGTRVITTNTPPINTIAGDAASYIPRMPNEIEESSDWLSISTSIIINTLNETQEERSLKIKQGFHQASIISPQKMIDAYLSFYEKAIAHSFLSSNTSSY